MSKQSSKKTTITGFINRNNQKNAGKTGIPGTDHNQFLYEMECLNCGKKYCANGSDIWDRKCPACQGGRSNASQYSVRRAEPRDIPAIMDLLVQVNMVHHNGRPDLFKGPTTKYTGDELAQILQSDETPVFVCVDRENRVLGHGFCVRQHAGGRLMEERDTLYIDDICVDETARGKRVGRALYEHILEYARSLGCYNVTLNVWSCNPGAMRFYEKLGLKPYKIGMEQIL